jgi:hypothetical protein
MNTDFSRAQHHLIEKISGVFVVLQVAVTVLDRSVFIHDQVSDTIGNIVEHFRNRCRHLEKGNRTMLSFDEYQQEFRVSSNVVRAGRHVAVSNVTIANYNRDSLGRTDRLCAT